MNPSDIPSSFDGDKLAKADVAPLPARACRGRLLLVDDDPMTGMVIEGWLRRNGYSTTFVPGPPEADRLLAATEFDLVLSDIHMPGNFRLEWVERLLSDADLPPVLLITGTPELETACRAANLPVAGYLLKPVDFSTLDDAIQRAVQEHRRRREFLSVIEDIIRTLGPASEPGSREESNVVGRLKDLSAGLRARAGRVAVGQVDAGAWRSAVTDSIAVIEKTKHSFRSKELGALRQRLQQMLAGHEAR